MLCGGMGAFVYDIYLFFFKISQISTQVQHQAQQQQQPQQVVTSQPQAQAQSTAFAAGSEADETSFFAGGNQATKTRGFNEIMSGQYTFLQDSEIDSQQEASKYS